MQTVLSYLMLLVTGMVMNAQNTIEVSMDGLKHDGGSVRVGLYNEAGDFLDTTYKLLQAAIENGKAHVAFNDIPDGTYAVSCYHDEDEDGEIDMFFGMFPTEPYGTSNNARAYFGPPKWEDAKFEVKNGALTKLKIQL